MKLAIDVTWLAVDYRGMGRYLESVLLRLLDRSGLDLTLMARDPAVAGPIAERLKRSIPTVVAWGAPAVDRVDVCWFPWNRVDTAPRTRRVVTIHDTAMVDWPETGRPFAWLDNRKMKGTLTRAVQRAQTIMAPSEFTKGRLMLHYPNLSPERIQVVSEGHRGLAGSEVRPSSLVPVPEPFVLYVGGLDPRKNARGLLQAWRQVPDHCLVMAGLEAQPDAPDRVVWAGRVGDEELQWLYAHCAATVVPSLYEGFGLPLLEAMAAGAPVVSSMAASLPEVGGDVPEYFDPHDTGDMARALTAVLHDPQRAAAIREAGLARAAEFTWERATTQVIECLSH